MNHTQNVRRFRANPIEIVIFGVVALTFINSVYRLCYDHPEFQPTILTPMSSNPLSEGRSLASTMQPLLTVDISCDNSAQKDTSANKIRLTGRLCGASAVESSEKLVKATITNSTNQFNATVFTKLYSGSYSTDYIPLTPGKNEIHITFSYLEGKGTSQDLVINKI